MTFNFMGRDIYLKKEIIFTIVAILMLASGVCGYLLQSRSGDIIVSKPENGTHGSKNTSESVSGTPGAKAEKTQNAKAEETISVYVVGCVKKEGIVTLKKGQLINDAIAAAGGATKDADLRNINLAYRLSENVMLEVRPKQTAKPSGQTQKPQQPAADPGNVMAGVKITSDSGGAVKNDTGVSASGGGSKKINLNTATLAELDSLPGVGEKTAQDIIDYRQTNGPFKKIEDIMEVPRIGDKKFESLKDYITV